MDLRWVGGLRFVWGGEWFFFLPFFLPWMWWLKIQANSDIIVASPKATFGLPEAMRGLYAGAGGLSRLVRLAGMTIASEIAMSGRFLSAAEAAQYNIVNRVSKTHESVVEETLEIAARIASMSPDAIIVTRHGLRASWELASVERASQDTETRYGLGLRNGENVGIGLRAFAEKKAPKWVASKL